MIKDVYYRKIVEMRLVLASDTIVDNLEPTNIIKNIYEFQSCQLLSKNKSHYTFVVVLALLCLCLLVYTFNIYLCLVLRLLLSSVLSLILPPLNLLSLLPKVSPSHP